MSRWIDGTAKREEQVTGRVVEMIVWKMGENGRITD